MKNQPKPIRTVEKLHTKNPLVKGEQIVDIWHNVRLTHNSVHKICDNADRIKKVLSHELKCLFA
jgi:hypothetical protein